MEAKKEQKAILVGVILIVIVLVIIFARAQMVNQPVEELADSDAPTATGGAQNTVPLISIAELEQLLREDDSAVTIIDVRTAADFAEIHIPQSRNIPLEILNAENFSLLRGSHLVFVGYDNADLSQNSFLTSGALTQDERVTYLDGGFIAWEIETGRIISRARPFDPADHLKMRSFSGEEVREIIEAKNTAYGLIDVRTAEEFARGAIPTAINIPLAEIERREGDVPVGRILIVYGNTELQSFEGAVPLSDLGFYAVRIISGGYTTWQESSRKPETLEEVATPENDEALESSEIELTEQVEEAL